MQQRDLPLFLLSFKEAEIKFIILPSKPSNVALRESSVTYAGAVTLGEAAKPDRGTDSSCEAGSSLAGGGMVICRHL